ncbi:MAG: VC0807 family protein [Verrucomicrobiota bacterium]
MSHKPKEHPLANILINVVIPVLILGYLSKDSALQTDPKPWHIGPVKAMIAALVLPLGYGLWSLVKTRTCNVFSVLGFLSVLLTGGLTVYLWNKDGTVKEHAGLLFGLKEGSIPLALGVAVLISTRTRTPLLKTFLYNDHIFDIAGIERQIAAKDNQAPYRLLLARATRWFALSFFISAALNITLALWFFRAFDHSAPSALETYNAIIGKLTFWGFVVIGGPILVFLFFTLRYLLRGLRLLTGFNDEQLMHPR